MATVEVMKSELDLFSKIQFQKSIDRHEFSQIHPANSIGENNDIEFLIPGTDKEYIDLQNIHLTITGKLVKQDGTAYTAEQDGRNSLIPYGLFTIWNQIAIYLNQTLISQPSNTQPYSAYFSVFLQSSLFKNITYLNPSGFYGTYSSGDFDWVKGDIANEYNGSRQFKLYGRFLGSIFECDKLLLNKTNLRIILTRGHSDFNCLGSEKKTDSAKTPPVEIAETKPKLIIEDASIFVRRVDVNESVRKAHRDVLSQGINAIYPFKRPLIKIINLNVQQNAFHIDNIYNGIMPTRLILGLTTVSAYSGHPHKNPFKFNHHNLSSLNLNFINEMIPKIPYTPDYDNNNYQREFYDFFLNIGAINNTEQVAVDYKHFKEHHCLYAFNFRPDFDTSHDTDWISEPLTGFLNIDMKFKSSLSSALKLICYMQFDSYFEIDQARNVYINY